jgi:23S rRNA pseudouridine1911/1915/1917 synthase
MEKELKPDILFEDQHLLVLSKPPGLLSQGAQPGEHNLVDWLRVYLKRNYVGLVHRLDRNTSGLMVVAKRTKSAERLSRSLQKGLLTREYLAWLEGSLAKEEVWRHSLWKDDNKNVVRIVSASHPGAKNAVLKVKPRAYGNWHSHPLTLAELVLETGRSHQIRVQAAEMSHPLLGDRKYGRAAEGFPRPALHSYRLRFHHPMTNELLAFEEKLPPDMAQIGLLSKPQG